MCAEPNSSILGTKDEAPGDAKADAAGDAKNSDPNPVSVADQEPPVTCPTLRGLAAAVRDRLAPSVDVALTAHAMHGGRGRP